MTRDDGGLSDDPMYPIAGMSLRDWFAGVALQGILANPGNDRGTFYSENASDAYKQADAMLAERCK